MTDTSSETCNYVDMWSHSHFLSSCNYGEKTMLLRLKIDTV